MNHFNSRTFSFINFQCYIFLAFKYLFINFLSVDCLLIYLLMLSIINILNYFYMYFKIQTCFFVCLFIQFDLNPIQFLNLDQLLTHRFLHIHSHPTSRQFQNTLHIDPKKEKAYNHRHTSSGPEIQSGKRLK